MIFFYNLPAKFLVCVTFLEYFDFVLKEVPISLTFQ